jgi:hypothetical protein
MAKVGDIQYRVECMSCGRRFLVDRVDAKIPSHPPKGEAKISHYPFIPCIGSGTVGMVIETVTKGLN